MVVENRKHEQTTQPFQNMLPGYIENRHFEIMPACVSSVQAQLDYTQTDCTVAGNIPLRALNPWGRSRTLTCRDKHDW